MIKNILEWLEDSSSIYNGKTVFCQGEEKISFADATEKAKSIGSALDKILVTNKPVAVFMERCVDTPVGYFGVLYSGRAYAPIDAKLPKKRIEKILKILEPEKILTQRALAESVKEYANEKDICLYEDLIGQEIEERRLQKIRSGCLATDPLCIIFTSGSSGNPKGVILSHQSLMTYLNAYSNVMRLSCDDRLGNQSPLDYIAAVRDIYLPIKEGCQTYIIPKEYFMSPGQLFGYLNEHQITCVGWSVSAFTIASTLGAFEETKLTSLRKICFSGSVMPGKVLRQWQKHLPDAQFVNQYGPTEATASCTYYELDHMVEEDEVLPIGKAYDGYRVFLLTEDQKLAEAGQEGEICVTGPGLTLGYYKDMERTRQVFVSNPLVDEYEERMYRTGDIGLIRADGNLEFHGRRDRQVKHMGHRVELDEIEWAAGQVEGVAECACVYELEKEKIQLYYTGEIEGKVLARELRGILPGFMVPRKVQKQKELPKLPNGKIDYKYLKGI